jgi:hypothetical protein
MAGAKNPNAKLSDEQVVEMRRLSREGHSYSALAARYGVTPATAFRAVVGQTWRHVSDDALPAQAVTRPAFVAA